MGDSSFRRHGLHNGAFCGRAKMPWKECNSMDERLKFIARLLEGEKMAVLCRQFGSSRKTGYKILTRYNEIGLEGLTGRSRRPYRHANQLPFQIETQIVRLKQDKPSWGAPKIRVSLYLILQTASFWRWPVHCRWWSGSDPFFPRNRDGVKECLQRRLAEAPAALMRSLLVVAFDP